MKVVFLIGLFSGLFLAANPSPCLAADAASANTQEEIKARVTKAMTAKRVVQVKLRTGAVIKGTVQEIAVDHFTLKEFDSQFMRDLRYADIDEVKEQSRLMTAMKNTGKVLSFIFLSRTGAILTVAALTVARLIVLHRRTSSRGGVLLTR